MQGHSDISERIKRGELPAILGSDTSTSADIWGFLQKLPDNLWWAFYDPQRVDVDDLGRLSEKALKRFYQPGLSLMRWTAFANPRFRKDGIDNLRAMDLDSYSYIEPVLYKADKIALENLEPLFSSETGNSSYDDIHSIATDIQTLAANVQQRGMTEENEGAYNIILHKLYDHQKTTKARLHALVKAADEAMEAIDAIDVPSVSKSLKRERVKALREHVIRLEKQGADLYKHAQITSKQLEALVHEDLRTKDQFSSKLADIGNTLQRRTDRAKSVADDLTDMAYIRQYRKVRVRDNGKIIAKETASAEDYRRLKLGVDLCFVPDVPQTLGIIDSDTLPHNAENYFILTVEYGLNNAFKDDGTYIPFGHRALNYGKEMTEYIAKMYSLGMYEDALYAIQLLKYAEGKDSHQLFPEAFQTSVRDHLASFYGVKATEIDKDPHAKLFLERVRDISGNRNHSPLVWGPRDTEQRYYKRMKDFIYGRMYPAADGFIATPLHQQIIQHPLIKMRSHALAYMTGGRVVPMSEMGRAAKSGNILEDEIGLGIKRNYFWWKKKQEKSDDNRHPPGFLKRAPVWFAIPTRTLMMSSVPAAILLGTGGVAAPMIIVVPVVTAGAVSGANYVFVGAKNAWALDFVNKPIKFAAKWGAIGGVAVGGTMLIAPVAPAIGAWGLGIAAAHPFVAAGVASPFVVLPALKFYTVVKNWGKKDPPPVGFGEYREKVRIDDDPLKLYNEDNEFLPLQPEPSYVSIQLKEETAKAPALNEVSRLVEEFLQRMENQTTRGNEDLANRIAGIFEASGTDKPDSPPSDSEPTSTPS